VIDDVIANFMVNIMKKLKVLRKKIVKEDLVV